MSVSSRALVDCAVLSLQDTCLFYPCCRGCFSRIDVAQQDTTRCRCSRCGYMCPRDQVEYRYRLSLRVARDRCIFGITVFGNSLNPFFGIHATGLQGLIENFDEPVRPSMRLALLVKAAEDCFIGRHFIFGMKVTETEPWLGGPVSEASNNKDPIQFVATQMILPKASGLGGCTVLSYYQSLLQKASEYKLGSADANKTNRLPPTSPLILSDNCSSSNFGSFTMPSSCLLTTSLLRVQQDSTLTPTPPWQQSFGLVTSSAEQEEGLGTQDGGGGRSTTPQPAQGGRPMSHKVKEEQSAFLCSQRSFYACPSFTNYIKKSYKNDNENLNENSWLSPHQFGIKSCNPEAKVFSTRQPDAMLSRPLVWEDLPFSESLSEFLCEENKKINSFNRTEQNLKMNREKETAFITELTSDVLKSHSQRLLDVANVPAVGEGDDHHSSTQDWTDSEELVNRSQVTNLISSEFKQDEDNTSLSFVNEEEQHKGDTYNCSADLFSSALTMNLETEVVRTTLNTSPLFFKLDNKHLKDENTSDSQLTPNIHKIKRTNCRGSLIPQVTEDFDFVPPSQSTPIVKVGVVPQVTSNLYRHFTAEISLQPYNQNSKPLYDWDSKNIPSKLTTAGTDQLFQSDSESAKENQAWGISRYSQRFTPKRRFGKPSNHKDYLKDQWLKSALKLRSVRTSQCKCDLRLSDVTLSKNEFSELIVPPTPVGEERVDVPLRGGRLSENGNSSLHCSWEMQQGNRVRKTLLHQTVTSKYGSPTEMRSCGTEPLDEERLDENPFCDWSRDLFSDSI
ncbi:uncharacterized protein ddias [Pholidichthys leucotaenia]